MRSERFTPKRAADAKRGSVLQVAPSKRGFRPSARKRELEFGGQVAVDFETNADLNENGRGPSHEILPVWSVQPRGYYSKCIEAQVPSWYIRIHGCVRGGRGRPTAKM